MTKLIVKNFTGKTTAVDADFDWTVAELKAAIAESKGNKNATRSNLVHGGHELRDHRRLSHYRIAEGDTLHITPPSKEPKIELKFEKDTDPGTIFTLAVDPSITVAQLKQEISIEEGADAVQLKYISTPDEPAPEVLVAGSSEEEEDDIVAPTLELLHDDAKLSSYPLQDEVITVYTRAHMITVSSMGAQVTIPVDPAKPIKLLRPVLSRHYAIPAPADLCFTWNGQDLLDEERSLLEYSVPSGAQVQLALPTEFSVTLALHDDDACKKVQVVATAHHTVEEFRNSVLIQHEMDLSDSVLIMMGRELAAEDKSLLELGVVPMCTIHAVEYLILRIKAESWTSNVLTLHPLTRLSALRPIIAQDMPAPDGSAPFTEYWFTVDGQSYLKESRTLWDLGIPSGSTLYLRPSGSKFTFTVKVRSAPDNGPRTYVIEAHDNELVSDFKSRVCDITGLSAKSRLSVRNKHMEDHRTLKDFDLVGGETLEMLHFVNPNGASPGASTSRASLPSSSSRLLREAGFEPTWSASAPGDHSSQGHEAFHHEHAPARTPGDDPGPAPNYFPSLPSDFYDRRVQGTGASSPEDTVTSSKYPSDESLVDDSGRLRHGADGEAQDLEGRVTPPPSSPTVEV